MKAAILAAYYLHQEDARKALRELKRKGIHRGVLIHKDFTGGTEISLLPLPSWFLSGGRRKLLADHSRWLRNEESVLLLRAPIASLRRPAKILRESGEISPVIFVLNPKRTGPVIETGERGMPLSPAELGERAQSLAKTDRVNADPPRSTQILSRLAQGLGWISKASLDLSEAVALGQRSTPVVEWILDNHYIIESNIRDVQQNLSRKFYRELPVLESNSCRGFPRIYGLAKELVSNTALRIDRDSILSFLQAYQSVATLSSAELWAIPQMIRIALIEGILTITAEGLAELRERETADFWAHRLIAADRHGSNHVFSIMAELTENYPAPGPSFVYQLVDHLYGEESSMALVHSWLGRIHHQTIEEINSREQERQTRVQIEAGNAFSSLRELERMDWKVVFERLSRVEQLLRLDPAGIYGRMDFATRDWYRRSLEQISRRSSKTEEEVARAAVDLACRAADEASADERRNHVGTFLIGERKDELYRLAGSREAVTDRLRRWATDYHTAVYLTGFLFFTIVFAAIFILFGLSSRSLYFRILFCGIALIPLSQLSIEVVNYLVMRLFPPRNLPKMDFKISGVPDCFRTLVVVPMMLTDEQTIDEQVQKLEIRYIANREDNLLFGLFTDFIDSDHQRTMQDEGLLNRVIAGLDALNQRCGCGRFFLLHRERAWSDSEQKYIGWERKRGKLEELNRLIDGSRPENSPKLVYLGNPDQLKTVRFIITLDSDTLMPSGTARRLIETLAHPLNFPRFDSEGRICAGSYSIIQPLVSPSLPSSSGSPFSRLFANVVGIDPYTSMISDVNQDLTGEGSYHGKGIYDVRAFSRILSGRFPDELLLSHDLIEGAHVRVGFAGDIELIDEFPQDYLTFASRLHRWIRGDWQITGWLLPRVPDSTGARAPNRLSWFNRWKILDNLRRSLIAPASLVLLSLAWAVSSGTAIAAAGIVGLQLIFNTLVKPLTMATTRGGFKGLSARKLYHDLLRAFAEASLIPFQSILVFNALALVGYRRFVSHKNLLEWTVGPGKRNSFLTHLPMQLGVMGIVSLCSGITGATLLFLAPGKLVFAAPWLVLWILLPLTGWLLNRRRSPKSHSTDLSEKDRTYLRKIARRSWRYYSQFICEETSWLPPDNYQVSHQDRLAMRTSPTNIGLWLLSAAAAHDFGYCTIDQVVHLLSKSMETISGLQRFEGHLLNWYDLQTLKPLEPRYVSMVDSGNLIGTLWALEQSLRRMIETPLLDKRLFEGLSDTVEVYEETVRRSDGLNEGGESSGLLRVCRLPASGIGEKLKLLRRMDGILGPDMDEDFSIPGSSAKADNWRREIRKQLSAWCALRDRYLRWIEILGEKTKSDISLPGEEASSETGTIAAIFDDLEQAPSLRSLSAGDVSCIRVLTAGRNLPELAAGPLAGWIDRILLAFEQGKWLAGEMIAVAERLIDDVHKLSESINMRFLYDTRKKIFPIGFHIADQRPDNAFYDLLASEARIGSFIAIARGDVPVEHWFAMGRPYNMIGRHRTLLSWTGTMFEYLMPQILFRSYNGSLLDKAYSEAVAVQVSYGRSRHVPWGISESAYSDLDNTRTYQYKAFGVPQLGLKRVLEEELVVAPYASLLALDIIPEKTIRNLRRLESLGLLQEYGFFDAIDFSRQRTRDGKRGVLVRTYMSHHIGMGFLSLSNFLHHGAVRYDFHRDPRVRAFEPLLHESIPTLSPRYMTARGQIPGVTYRTGEITPSVSSFDSPNTDTPRTQLLGNGRYSLMVTNSGGGYSQWKGIEITRWRSDPSLDSGGVLCYLHETDRDLLWSNTFHPAGGKTETYNASFALDRAVIRRIDDGIETMTEIAVSPEDDVEIRRLTLINQSHRIRRLELTSYIELSLAPHGADLQHPAFNKLFIQTEAIAGRQALIAWRRQRRDDEQDLFVAHRFSSERPDEAADAFRFETDRRTFIGRGKTLVNPDGVFLEPGGREGYVLDPIFSLRRTVVLKPGERRQVSLILGAAESRERILALMDKYEDLHAIDRAMDFSWASAQLELRSLRIQSDEALRFQQIASYLLFPNSRLRPQEKRLQENRKGQAGLWPYGISGDVPIILVSIADIRDVGLVDQILRAQAYWRIHGFITDLVILNEETEGYEHPLRSHLEALTRVRPSRVFLLQQDQLPLEDLSLLMAAARVVLVAARGALSQQIGFVAELPPLAQLSVKKRQDTDPSAPLPFMELHYFNSLGGFTDGGREYVIYLGSDSSTPAPWVNVMANPGFGTLISETGAGFTWFGNSQRNRLTAWSNDPVTDPAPEVIYIRDEESGDLWSPTASPIRENQAYRARHGAGYSVFEHNSHGIEQELTLFVPVNEKGGDPVKLQRLKLTNSTPRTRILSVTHYLEWTLGENRESSLMHIATSWDKELHALTARNRYHPEYGDRVSFTSLTPPAVSYTGDRAHFIGRNRTISRPAAMERISLSSRTGSALDPCSALQTVLELAPGETAEVICLTGQAESSKRARELILLYRGAGAFESALDETKVWWDGILGSIEVETPEYSTNFLINRWLLYQSLSCRMWGRSASYQSGGAFGFRDQLQDAMAFVYTRPEIAREQILLAASRQFLEGDVQHWWHPPGGAGIRSRISDDLLWLPHVTAHYVRTTGDSGILEENVPFLKAPLLEADQHELFSIPETSSDHASLFEHCLRAVERGLTSGPHGLPLIGTGDWNDGMNLVGAEGKGESVWLGWFLADVLKGMEMLAEIRGDSQLQGDLSKKRAVLVQSIEEAAWDGNWYLRAFFDDGSPIGSSENTEARIDSLPQSWARLSGAGDEERTAKALESAWQRLVRAEDALVLLFEPPFDRIQPSPGYIKGYPPGVRENGGQYTHASVWLAMAFARGGDGDKAAEILRLLNPIEQTGNPAALQRYRVEPYVVAADVYRLPGCTGRGGWSWYTGSAAWMYRTWIEEVLGMKIRGNTLRIDPVLPGRWKGFSLRYRHGEAVYEIQIDNPAGCVRGVVKVEMDGQQIPKGVIVLEQTSVIHRVYVRMGKQNPDIPQA
ncbi:GH36-type glycosyl hydrolase domain-containing protein [Marispirochaeta sp.]|uniref:GH36-type glycosyl hydrolase domain-containing protein n=1 Tax=Marispirochaeta sp. TaxID=2038653 RepID=UPI0029C75072|nr:glucoamylase family protein [Marispirochaeta sp.]